MTKETKIFVAGHMGMVGSAIVRELNRMGLSNIVVRTLAELDLRCQVSTENFFAAEKPEVVFLAAAKVGGILANMNNQGSFLLENLQIQCNIIDSAYRHNVSKLLFLGSSCIFPKEAVQPMQETALLTGALEPTNEGYAIAKIAGLKMCEYYNRQAGANFISVMPCNLYGYNDNFDLQNSHFLPALIRKFHDAKVSNNDTVTVWGTGKVYRELLFVDDLAKACIFLIKNYSDSEFINIGSGYDYTISDIANMVKDIVGYRGEIVYDTTKPDGMYRKILDSTKIKNLGWNPGVELCDGIALTYKWYVENLDSFRK